MTKMERKININLPEKLQETISRYQEDDGELAQYYIKLLDEVSGYFLNENVLSVVDIDMAKLISMLRDIRAIRMDLSSFVAK